MVREIIAVQVGQCGNQIVAEFWKTMTKEHEVGEDSKFTGNKVQDTARVATIDVYFNETGENRYVTRVLLVDLEPDALDVVQATLVAAIFKPDNYVQGANCAGNNCAKGHYTEGAELIDEGIDVIHKKTEACDCFHGYQISLGGSTGSGMGTL